MRPLEVLAPQSQAIMPPRPLMFYMLLATCVCICGPIANFVGCLGPMWPHSGMLGTRCVPSFPPQRTVEGPTWSHTLLLSLWKDLCSSCVCVCVCGATDCQQARSRTAVLIWLCFRWLGLIWPGVLGALLAKAGVVMAFGLQCFQLGTCLGVVVG
jgi:hypothetical protein